MRKPTSTTRRFFLRGVGGAALALPFLPSLLPTGTRAQPPAQPRRFIAVKSGNGQMALDWFPTATPAGYVLHDALYSGDKADGTTALHENVPGTPYRQARLSDFAATGLSRIVGTAFNPFLDKMGLVRGLDQLQYTSHNSCCTLGNYGEGPDVGGTPMPTIDQVMAYSDRFYPTPPRLRSLEIGTGSPETFAYSDFGLSGGAVEQLDAYLNPRDAWDAVFGGFTPPGETPTIDPNLHLLDRVHEDYSRLSRSSRLSVDDRMTLERHMSFLHEIRRGLETIPLTCTVPPVPPSIENGYPWAEGDPDELRRTVELMVDISVAALMCDVTRIVTFNLQEVLSDGRGTWATYYNDSATPGSWHGDAHDFGDAVADHNILQLNRWIANEVILRYLQRLDVLEGDGRTYLDNSLFFWGNEFSFEHYSHNMPTFLAGGAGGAIRTGYYVDYTDWDNDYANAAGGGVIIPGVAHNRFLVTVMQAMGLEPTDYERDGRPGYGEREVTGWGSYPPAPSDTSNMGVPLPGLFVG
jgi:hypothetical protein